MYSQQVELVSTAKESIGSFQNEHAALYLLSLDIQLDCKCVAAQRLTLMHMLEHHIMWHQKSGTTSRTTIRGTYNYGLVDSFFHLFFNNKGEKNINT